MDELIKPLGIVGLVNAAATAGSYVYTFHQGQTTQTQMESMRTGILKEMAIEIENLKRRVQLLEGMLGVGTNRTPQPNTTPARVAPRHLPRKPTLPPPPPSHTPKDQDNDFELSDIEDEEPTYTQEPKEKVKEEPRVQEVTDDTEDLEELLLSRFQ